MPASLALLRAIVTLTADGHPSISQPRIRKNGRWLIIKYQDNGLRRELASQEPAALLRRFGGVLSA